MRPKVALTLDWQEKGTFSSRKHYALREHYFDYIHAIGGVPIAMPYIDDLMDDYLDQVDAVIMPGGFFSFPDEWYLDKEESSPYDISPRTQYDIKFAKKCLEQDKPFLGICAGMQIMGAIAGGKMTADLHKYYDTKTDHINGAPAEEYAHQVNVKKDSLIHKIVEEDSFEVNSAHREAIVKIPESSECYASCIAPDGVIEAVEFKNKRFAVGVQWHPEFFLDSDNPNFKIGKALIDEAKK